MDKQDNSCVHQSLGSQSNNVIKKEMYVFTTYIEFAWFSFSFSSTDQSGIEHCILTLWRLLNHCRHPDGFHSTQIAEISTYKIIWQNISDNNLNYWQRGRRIDHEWQGAYCTPKLFCLTSVVFVPLGLLRIDFEA